MIAQSWNEVWVAIRDALRDARVSEESYPEVVFLRSLESRGLTILPLEIRRMADLFGAAAVAKAEGWYLPIRAQDWSLHAVRHEDADAR